MRIDAHHHFWRYNSDEYDWIDDSMSCLRRDFLPGDLKPELDLTYDILIYPRHLAVATEFVQHFPRQRFVLDHLAKPLIKSGSLDPWSSGIRDLAQFPNVFCKLSGLVTEADWKSWKPEHIAPYLDVALECFGPERLMIGSDWPVCTVAGSFAQVMNLVLDFFSKYPEDLRNAILG